jgi:hypothetical protein
MFDGQYMTLIAIFLVEVVLFFFIRLLPVWKLRNQGCDAYYFLLSAEVFRAQKKIPVQLPPYYLADIDEQWYPPGFTVLLGLLPEWAVTRYYWLINHLLDFLNFVLMDFFLWYVSNSVDVIIVANLVYIFIPVFMSEYSALTSRSLANLFFSGFVISLYFVMNSIGNGALEWVSVVALLAAWFLILFTHKLTTQLGVFMIIAFSVLYQSILPFFIIAVGIPIFIILTKGYYWKMLRAHWDIVSFWHKNLRWLGAHQVYESPLFSKSDGSATTKIPYTKKILIALIFYNPFIYFVLLSFLGLEGEFLSDPMLYYLFLCVLVVFAWSIATTFIPYVKSLGEGFKYIKYTGFPAAVFIGLAYPEMTVTGKAFLAFILIFSILCILSGMKIQLNRSLGKIDEDLSELLSYLKQSPEVDMLGCIDCHMCDAIVYFARKKVLWGTHHYLFNEKIIRFFPVLRASIDDLSREFGLKYWCINTDYVNPEDLRMKNVSITRSFGKFSIYKVLG